MALRSSPVLNQLRRLAGRQADALPDALLLERFVAERDEEAFEVLLWRHGGMVLSVCRRLLRREQDVEDAFQATFLALVRKARSIANREALASWLYKVAYRVALDAREAAARQPATEADAAEPTVAPSEDPIWRDLAPVLDEELYRLPEKYRVPVVLCYLQGRTVDEAAQVLGCPRGTVGTRLARARERLRAQLTQRGVMLSVVTLTALLVQQATAAGPPAALVATTARLAALATAGHAAATASVTALANGVLRAMFLGKLKMVGMATLAVTVLGLGLCGLCQSQSTAAPRPAANPWHARPVQGQANDPDDPHAQGWGPPRKENHCQRCHVGVMGTNPHPRLGVGEGPLALRGWGVAIDPAGDTRFSVEKGALTLTVAPGEHALAAEKGRMNAPRILQEVQGDFIVQVRVASRPLLGVKSVVEAHLPIHTAGLLLWQDSRNYVRLKRASILPKGGEGRSFAGLELRRDGKLEREGNVQPLEGGATWLRLERRGVKVLGAISADAVRWTAFEPVALRLPQRCYIGVAAGQNTTVPFEASFSEFELFHKVTAAAGAGGMPAGPVIDEPALPGQPAPGWPALPGPGGPGVAAPMPGQ
jgi:RNA polymerase sigma factor (sigma-70 family)